MNKAIVILSIFLFLSCSHSVQNENVIYQQVTVFGFFAGPNQIGIGYVMARNISISKDAVQNGYDVAAKFAIKDGSQTTSGFDMVATGQAAVLAVGIKSGINK